MVYSAGLTDYRNDQKFSMVLSTIHDALVPGGLAAVGNFASGNRNRWGMEYFTEWFLIHRSPEELRAFAAKLHRTPALADVGAAPVGGNLVLLLHRRGCLTIR